MTDLDKLKATLTEIGCEYIETTSLEEWNEVEHTSEYDGNAKWDVKIKLDNGIGYYGFNCEFYFLNGKFQKHGVWE